MLAMRCEPNLYQGIIISMFESLSCPNCGASIAVSGLKGNIVGCDYCGTSFRIPDSLTPEPEMGDLMLGADFTDPDVPGWVVVNREKLTFTPGPPAEMWVKFPKSDRIHPVLRTPAPFDDFDISVTIRFISGDYKQISAGLELRFSDDGDYVIRISSQGTFSVGWHEKTEWGGHLIKWTTHPSLRTTLGEPNRLRVVMWGDQIRIYLNGVLATSLRDDRYTVGKLRLVVSPGEDSPLEVAFSDFQLREPS
jgi:hypothetical protein